ncbi:MAG: bifunctional phosphopantothenoylcysteine decarboxylase/phosphopantothenate--cysteine ligase CoaBC [Nitriliruptorales bacterium]
MAPDVAAPLVGTRIVLGVCGGIAAYKAAILARLLMKAGATVDTVLTRGATHLIGGATFAGITGRPARTEVWAELGQGPDRGSGPRSAPHIALARGADAIVVAPATAQVIAKAAAGMADDLLTNVLLMARCPVLLAPAMHTEMWEHPATRANIALLGERGIDLVGPASGELAGGDVGEGRMSEPEEILDALVALLRATRDLEGRTVVVSAGPTREHIDAVRFLSNRSSGKMGFALAAEAVRRGAEVHLVTGPVRLDTPAGVERHDVVSARDMREIVTKLAADADVVVKAAAVSDFRPVQAADRKIKKAAGTPEITLEPNPDILAELGASRDGDRPVLVGFAAETDDPERHGRQKLEEKRADLVVVNDVSASDAGFEVETNRVVVLGRDGRRVDIPLGSKRGIAARVWDEIVTVLGPGR